MQRVLRNDGISAPSLDLDESLSCERRLDIDCNSEQVKSLFNSYNHIGFQVTRNGTVVGVDKAGTELNTKTFTELSATREEMIYLVMYEVFVTKKIFGNGLEE